MSLYLKQSTTTNIKVGPFVDKTDGVTVESALTPTVQLSKNGGALATRNSATATAHDANGWYTVELNTTDTNTLGRLQVAVTDAATHLPVLQNYTVLPANVFDSLIGGSDLLQVDLQEINGSTAPADNLERAGNGIVLSTFAAGSTASVFVTNLTEATNDHYKGAMVNITSGALAGQRLRITAYNGTTKALTVTNQTSDIPSSTDQFYIT
jgi:hypothetical protein